MSTSFILHASYVISVMLEQWFLQCLILEMSLFHSWSFLFTLRYSLFLIRRLDAAFLFQHVPKIFNFLINP